MQMVVIVRVVAGVERALQKTGGAEQLREAPSAKCQRQDLVGRQHLVDVAAQQQRFDAAPTAWGLENHVDVLLCCCFHNFFLPMFTAAVQGLAAAVV